MSEETNTGNTGQEEIKVKAITLKPNRPFIERFLQDTYQNQAGSGGLATDSAEEVLEGLYSGATAEPEVIRETVEVPIQVGENQILFDLSPAQKEVLEVIAKKRQVAFKFPDPETIPELLLRSFFTRAYLFNYFNEFYTGLTQKDVKAAEKQEEPATDADA